MVSVGSSYPLDESLLPKDMLLGPVGRFPDCQAISLAGGVCHTPCYELLSDTSSAESFSYAQQKEMDRFALGANLIPPVRGLQLTKNIEDRFELCAEAFQSGRKL